MAQLKDTLIAGSLRVTDTIFSTNLNLSSLTASQAVVTDDSKNLISRGIRNNTSIGTLGWTAAATDITLVTTNTIAYWNGAYTGTTSNLSVLGTVTTGVWNATKINPNKGGTGIDSYTKGDILYAGANIANTATTALSKLALGTAGYTLQATANGPAWTQTVAVANGGTGKTSWTQWGILYASASTTLTNTAAGTSGYLLQGNGSAAPSWIQATNANTASTIVKRDASGNFSAGTITASLNGNANTATKVLDAGDTSKSLSIRYSGSGASATDWIPFYDSDGNLVPVSSTNLANKVKDKASGSWGISITGSAAKLGTATVGGTNRPIYLSTGTATEVDWYYNSCTISGGNKANYPWHRFATCTTGTGQWTDKTVIVILHSRFNGGEYGMVKLSMRTNATGENKSTSAVWIYRKGFAENDIKISAPTKTTGTDETINAYVKCGTYPRRIAFILEGSNLGWSLVSSNEPNDTTSSDKKGGTEINASVSGNDATDGTTVSYANKAGGLTDGSNTMTSAYNKAGLEYANYTWLAGWNGYELRAVNKSQFARVDHTNINGTNRNLQIRYGQVQGLAWGTQTAVTFSSAFSNACLVVIPFSSHLGFAAAQSINVGNFSKTGCTLYQYNTSNVACTCSYVAIGY